MSGTITNQIEVAEKEIEECEKQLEFIEKSLRLKDMTLTERLTLKEEEKQLQRRKQNFETTLRNLRKENWKNMLVSVMIMGLLYLTYHFIWAP